MTITADQVHVLLSCLVMFTIALSTYIVFTAVKELLR